MDWNEVAYFGCTLLFALYEFFCFLVGAILGHFLIYRVRG